MNYLENMNELNQDINTEFNHESKFDNVRAFRRTSSFSEYMKTRIIEFMQ